MGGVIHEITFLPLVTKDPLACRRCGQRRTVAKTVNAGWQLVCPVCEVDRAH